MTMESNELTQEKADIIVRRWLTHHLTLVELVKNIKKRREGEMNGKEH